MAIAFSSRPDGYKVGVVLLLLSTVTALLGLCSSFLKESMKLACFHNDDVNIQDCYINDVQVTNSSIPIWYPVWTTLNVICVIILVVAVIYCFIFNCCKANNSRCIETLSALGGLAGCACAKIYFGITNELNTLKPELNTLKPELNTLKPEHFSDMLPFYLTSIGSILAFMSAVAIACNNKQTSRAH